MCCMFTTSVCICILLLHCRYVCCDPEFVSILSYTGAFVAKTPLLFCIVHSPFGIDHAYIVPFGRLMCPLLVLIVISYIFIYARTHTYMCMRKIHRNSFKVRSLKVSRRCVHNFALKSSQWINNKKNSSLMLHTLIYTHTPIRHWISFSFLQSILLFFCYYCFWEAWLFLYLIFHFI